jgi:DNA-binding transcriptional MocR family regulator
MQSMVIMYAYNSMMTWRPRIDRKSGPLYLALAAAIAHDVQSGKLRPGDRLPPHRELADQLGVTVTTVTRGYTEAERQGLVRGEVGRGTYVSPPPFTAVAPVGSDQIDLATNALLPHQHARELIDKLSWLVSRSTPEYLFNYQPHGGRPDHREIAARWLQRAHVPATAANTLLTSGAQHAMAVSLAALTAPGDVVLCESVTYTGMRSLAHHLHVRAHPVTMDHEGLLPDALEDAAHECGARVVYCVPSGQNPTARVMSKKRRQDLARVATRLDLTIVEDDAYGFLFDGQQPLCAAIPERTFYLTSMSKSLVPGMRVGLLRTPPGWTDRVTGAVFATTVMLSPMDAAAACASMEDGTAARVMEWKRQEVRARQQIARQALGAVVTGSPDSQHGWLQLPASWSADDFTREARQRGVIVTAGREFAVARHDVPNAVRIALGAPADRETLKQAVTTLAEILKDAPQAFGMTV